MPPTSLMNYLRCKRKCQMTIWTTDGYIVDRADEETNA